VNKRTLTAAIVLALLAGGAIGGLIGFAWHAPGHPSTWDDIRSWATLAVLVLGFTVAAYELNLQRRQFADQARRSIGRDALLDGQLRELQQRAELTRREQAEAIGLGLGQTSPSVSGGTPEYLATVQNGSRRLIRDVTCRLLPGDHRDAQSAKTVGQLANAGSASPIAPPTLINTRPGHHARIIRSGQTCGFAFNCEPATAPDAQVIARFTDDAGIHWQISPDLHLEDLDQRDW
jgi:hypothetical protein